MISTRRIGKVPPLVIAEAENIGTGAFRRFERTERKGRIRVVAIKKMFRVVDHFAAVRLR